MSGFGVQGLGLGSIPEIVQQITSTAAALLEFLGAPLKFAWNWLSTRWALQKKLGEWSSEARKSGRWQQPVLGTEAFERHLKNRKGRLEPTDDKTSTFAWAYLLYALNIRPGDLVLQWEPLPDGFDPQKTGQLPLKIEGPVLCHILNLYRLYSNPNPQYFDEQKAESEITLTFGTISISKDGRGFAATFRQRNPEALKRAKVPFTFNSPTVQDGPHLQFPAEQVVDIYLATLTRGVSDESCKWPHREAVLSERSKGLVKNLEWLRRDEPQSPYLVCHSWLEEGSRIYRRVTTNDEEDPKLLQDIASSFSADSHTKEALEALAPEGNKDRRDWKSRLIKILRDRCLFKDGTISLVWASGGHTADRTDSRIAEVAEANLRDILATLPEKSGVLTQEVRTMPDEVAYIFNKGPEVRNSPGLVLEFTPESQLWKSTLEMGG